MYLWMKVNLSCILICYDIALIYIIYEIRFKNIKKNLAIQEIVRELWKIHYHILQ